jgi:spore coat protein U-like protein
MASGANRLNFDLYKDGARTQPWGNYTTPFLGGGSQFDLTTNGSGNIVNATRTVFARLPGSQQAAVPGAYTESMPVSTSNDLQYNTTASTATACPTGNRTQTYAFTVTATVITTCNIGATTHSFGSSGVLVNNVDATSTLTATCTSTTPYNVGLNAGTGAGATVATRKMTSGGNTINYSLYTDSARTTVWGNTVGTDTVAGTGSGLGQDLTVFGRVPAQTTPAPATYSDTIITTVTY